MHDQRHRFTRLFGALLIALLLSTIVPGHALLNPTSVEAHVRTQQGGSFASGVGCLNTTDQFAVTRHTNNLYAPTANVGAEPAIQHLSAAGVGSSVANLASVGAIYGLAYDDGAASGRERLFAAAFTKRFVNYGPGGPGAIYLFTRSSPTSAWTLSSSRITVPNVNGVNRATPFDTDAIAGVGTSSLGGMVISPDGRTLLVMNLEQRSIERFDLTISGTPVRLSPINLTESAFPTLFPDPAVRTDLRPFALAFYPLTFDSVGSQALYIGVTDSAARANGAWPRAHVLAVHIADGGRGSPMVVDGSIWHRVVDHDLSTPSSFWDAGNRHRDARSGYPSHVAMMMDSLQELWEMELRQWNPWRTTGFPVRVAANSTYAEYLYPQPLLTEITLIAEAAQTPSPGFGAISMALGLRDRMGDQAFNADAAIPPEALATTAQGDTLFFRFINGNWTLVSGERYDDSSLHPSLPATLRLPVDEYGNPLSRAHVENHMGGLATVLNDQTTVDTIGSTVATTSLGGVGIQEVRLFAYAEGAGANQVATARPMVVGQATWTPVKANNLGDLELLCSYALVGGRVWVDGDGDGMRRSHETTGIANLVLEAFRATRGTALDVATAPAIATLRSDSQGRYLFAVPPNTYCPYLAYRVQ